MAIGGTGPVPVMITCSPGWRRMRFVNAWYGVPMAFAITAACANGSPSGRATRFTAGTTVYSA